MKPDAAPRDDTTDLVQRLQIERYSMSATKLCTEAADTIERLQSELERKEARCGALTVLRNAEKRRADEAERLERAAIEGFDRLQSKLDEAESRANSLMRVDVVRERDALQSRLDAIVAMAHQIPWDPDEPAFALRKLILDSESSATRKALTTVLEYAAALPDDGPKEGS